MKIGIYSELYAGGALGGREYIVAVLCEVFTQQGHFVEYIHHLEDLTSDAFSERFGISRESVRLRRITTRPPATVRNFVRSRRLRQKWNRALSSKYDLFINIVHGAPARCYAKHGVLMILFPFFKPFDAWSGRVSDARGRSDAWVISRHLYHRIQWPWLMRSYPLKTSISDYSRRWTVQRWGVDSEVIYPPGDSSFISGEKKNFILSVGRFSGFRVGGLSKRQVEMMRAFGDLIDCGLSGWQYHSVGGLSEWPQDQAYLAEVQNMALRASSRAHVSANASRTLLKHLYESSKIFWHAAGYGDNDSLQPELMEHFGIATVDAMAAGCVPVVINKGAQPEIVEHGVSGFVWSTLEELKNYTARLIEDEPLRIRIAAEAQKRAQGFNREAFVKRFRAFIRPVLGNGVLST